MSIDGIFFLTFFLVLFYRTYRQLDSASTSYYVYQPRPHWAKGYESLNQRQFQQVGLHG